MTNVSNCCGADILNPDSQGHGKCSSCKENCVPDKESDDSWVDRRTEVGRDLQSTLDNLMGSPLEQIDSLIKQANKLKEKYAR